MPPKFKSKAAVPIPSVPVPARLESIIKRGYEKDVIVQETNKVLKETAPTEVLRQVRESRQADVQVSVPGADRDFSAVVGDLYVKAAKLRSDLTPRLQEAYEAKLRIPIGTIDDANKMEYGLFLSPGDIDEHVNVLRVLMQTGDDLTPQQFQQKLAETFVMAQNLTTTTESHEFNWHETVTPVQNSIMPKFKPKTNLETTNPQWKFIKRYVDVRKTHVNDFVIPILRSSCSPHCTFQNVGSGTLTADIDISVMSTRGGILKYIANHLTRIVFTRLGFVERVVVTPGIVVTFDLGDLPSLMDTNVYPTGWYNICRNTNIAPFESCIDKNFFIDEASEKLLELGVPAAAAAAAAPPGPGYSFVACQLVWSMVRLLYAQDYKQHVIGALPEDGNFFREITNLGILAEDVSQIPAVEYALQKLEKTANYPVDDKFRKEYIDAFLHPSPAGAAGGGGPPSRSIRAESIDYLTPEMVSHINLVLIEAYIDYIDTVLNDPTRLTDAFNAYKASPGLSRPLANEQKLVDWIAQYKSRKLKDLSSWADGSGGFFKLLKYTNKPIGKIFETLSAEVKNRVEAMHLIRMPRKPGSGVYVSGKKRTKKVLAYLIQTVERSLRNYQTRVQIVNGMFFRKQKELEGKVEEDQKNAGDSLLLDRATLKTAKKNKLQEAGTGVFDTTAKFEEDKKNVLAKLERAFHYEYFTLQSMLYAFEEEAYLSIGAYLHVVIQEQKGEDVREDYLGQFVYWMSFFDNLGFLYETHKLKYFDRMVNAVFRICLKNGINAVKKDNPLTAKDHLQNAYFFAKFLTANKGLHKSSNGLAFIQSSIQAFNLVMQYSLSATNPYKDFFDQGCYRLILSSQDALEVGDIVVYHDVPHVVVSLYNNTTTKVNPVVQVSQFTVSATDGTIALTGALQTVNVSNLRKKNKGYTIVPEHYTFTGV
jgi:hypothetical protein